MGTAFIRAATCGCTARRAGPSTSTAEPKPWEFQFGTEYSPLGPTGSRGAPFLAVNGHLRQEVDFGGTLIVQAGWQWRGRTGHLMRRGLEYFNGQSEQYQFFHDHEQLVGIGVWYDY